MITEGGILEVGKEYLLQSFYQNEQWVGRGKFVAVIPSGVIIHTHLLTKYFGDATDPSVGKPAGVARYIFEKENGRYIVLPDAARNSAFEAP